MCALQATTPTTSSSGSQRPDSLAAHTHTHTPPLRGRGLLIREYMRQEALVPDDHAPPTSKHLARTGGRHSVTAPPIVSGV